MSTHKYIDKVCCVILVFTLLLTVFFVNAESFGIKRTSSAPGYENRLFNISRVHTIDIVMDNWDEFLADCKNEEYFPCSVIIDNEAYKNVAIRAKGNTSLTQVESYGNDRYSFKIEFDHYDSSKTYYGLDKLCLNNIIQDNTYMKDYLTYQMMAQTGVASPLCSYVNITVNGEDFGLYLAVEGVEEAFLQRNYGKDYGELYKPDSTGMGGGRGNGEKFDMGEFLGNTESENTDSIDAPSGTNQQAPQTPVNRPENNSNTTGQMPDDMIGGQKPGGIQEGTPPELPKGGSLFNHGAGEMPGGGMSSDDVLLKYIDDEPDSYPNIFNNAKTDINDSDKNRLIESLQRLSRVENLDAAVDVEAVIRYFAVHNFVLNFDSYTGSMIHNYYLYEKDGQMQMIPWDYNLAFGGFQSMDGATSLVNYPIDSPVSGGNVEDRPMIAWIYANEEYTELYHNYFSEFISEWFDSGNFENMIDGVSAMIAPYVEKDPTKFCTYEEYEIGVSTLKEFCLLRAESIEGQLNGTIGSAFETQQSGTLIDACNLQISDMGAMQNFRGDGMDEPDGSMRHQQGAANYNGADQLPSSGEGNGGLSQRMLSNNSNSMENNAESITFPRTPGVQMQGGHPPDQPNSYTQGNAPADMNGRTPNVNGQSPFGQSAVYSTPFMWIAVSTGILAIGVVFAFEFRRRKQ